MPPLPTSWRSILILSLPFTPQSSKWSLSFRFPHQTPACTSPVPHTCHMLRQYHSWCSHPKLWKNIWSNAVLRQVQLRVYLVKLIQNFVWYVAWHVPRMGEGRGVFRVLVGKPEGKRPLERLRRRWEDNIKMDLQGMGCESMDWIELAYDRGRWRALVNAIMNLRVP